MRAETINLGGFDDDSIEAYLARPTGDERVGGVVVIHHMPGYDESTKEITRRFAAHGYNAICVNLYSREAPGASSDDAAAAARALGGVPDERLIGDVKAAAEHLRSLENSNARVGVIGYCSGGRQSLLSACSLDFDAAVDCYGAFVLVAPPPSYPLARTPLQGVLANLSCPLLGLFGAEDEFPTPEEVETLRTLLTEHAKEFEFHTYEGAGHAFFNVDRPSYRPDVAREAWDEIWKFFALHLGAAN